MKVNLLVFIPLITFLLFLIVFHIIKTLHYKEAISKREAYLNALVEVQRGVLQSIGEKNYHNRLLEILGHTSEASRVYIFKNSFSDAGTLMMSQIAEWCAPGIQPEIDNPLLQKLPYEEGFERWASILNNGDAIYGNVSDFPEDEREILKPQGILSILVLPLIVNEKFYGFIGFDNCYQEREWEIAEINLLKSAAVAISLDIERSIANDKLREALYKAEEANKTKSEFLAVMSHELRTPLTSILGFSELLMYDKSLNDNHKIQVTKINKSATRLLQILSDLLELSVIEAGRIKIKYKKFELNKLLNDTKILFEDKLNRKRINLNYSLNGVNSIYTDQLRLNQVLLNLIGNAIKFTGKAGKINIDVFKKNDKYLFSVSDTGIGISKESLMEIFEMFKQGESPYQRRYSGVGLGLGICKRLINILDGEIWVESEKNVGSTFYFTLPIIKEDEKTVIDKNKTDDVNFLNVKLKSKRKVLFVEDDDYIYEIIEKSLKRIENCIFKGFKTGHELLNYIENNDDKVHLIIIDVQNKDMSGIEIQEKIKQKLPNIFMCSLTAFAMDGDKERFLETGFDAYIPKPIKINEFIIEVKKILKLDL